MTTEPEQDGEPPRRRFDDVASLFGTIVPPAGTPVRPGDEPGMRVPPPILQAPLEAPPHLTEGVRAPQGGLPPLDAERMPPMGEGLPPMSEGVLPLGARPMPLRPGLQSDMAPAPAWQGPRPPPAPPRFVRKEGQGSGRPPPKEVPWPDAFEPLPNFRRREPRNWSWLLLIPVGFVAAVAISSINPRAIRDWVGVHVLGHAPVEGTTAMPGFESSSPSAPDAGLPPGPATRPTPDPTPEASAPQSNSTPQAAPPAAAPAPTLAPGLAPDTPIPFPAIPTSPAPNRSSADPADEPDVASDAGSVPLHITIQYRRRVPGADGEARRIASLLQGNKGSVELHPSTATVRAPTIDYYNPGDKAAAKALAASLANEANGWVVRAGTGKNPPGTLDVWLP